MLLNRPIVSPMVKGAIDEIKKSNQECSIEEIIWLHQLAQKVVNPIPFKNHDMLDIPIEIGSLTFYPLTIGARIWYETFGDKIVNNPPKWRKSDSETQRWVITVLGFLHFNSQNCEYLEKLTLEKAYNDIIKWEWKLKITHNQLIDIIYKLSDLYEEVNESIKDPPFYKSRQVINQASIDYGDGIARLLSSFGQTPNYWLWEVNEKEFWSFVQKSNIESNKGNETVDIGKHYSNLALAEFKSLVWWIKNGRPTEMDSVKTLVSEQKSEPITNTIEEAPKNKVE
jgi:hypothetical protein